VKELRKQGEREAAEAVKALRKPTVAAWALNQLARTRSKDVERLIAAGEELRSAQEELIGGGDRSSFQEAAGAERELVAELSADATTLASEAGERGGGLREKVAETLHAAALDDETAEELRAGRLTREREAIGGFGAPGGGPAPTPSRREAKPKPKPKAKKSSSRSKPATAADGDDAERRQQLAAARTDERHARRVLEAAAKAAQHAQERADAARTHAEEATKRSKTTAERLREAKKAERAARKAHAHAERALESAERGS
jgi:hypothetical protein